MKQELRENSSAIPVRIGRMECAYSKEMFEEEGAYYTSHLWITGADEVAFECSFTVKKRRAGCRSGEDYRFAGNAEGWSEVSSGDNSGAPFGNLPD